VRGGLNSAGASVVSFLAAIVFSAITVTVASSDSRMKHDLSPLIAQPEERVEELLDIFGEPKDSSIQNHSCASVDHYDFLEVAALAHSGGFPRSELHTAVAVAYAESLGDPSAINRNRNGSKDSGLWQINSVHGFSDLLDPLENARAAYEVWLVQGWTAWYAHTPRGGEYGSGERFQEWLKESKCTIDFYHDLMVYYNLIDERNRGEDARFDALSALR